MDFKVYILIEAPVLEKTYEIFAPIDRRIYELIAILQKTIPELSEGYYKNNKPKTTKTIVYTKRMDKELNNKSKKLLDTLLNKQDKKGNNYSFITIETKEIKN